MKYFLIICEMDLTIAHLFAKVTPCHEALSTCNFLDNTLIIC